MRVDKQLPIGGTAFFNINHCYLDPTGLLSSGALALVRGRLPDIRAASAAVESSWSSYHQDSSTTIGGVFGEKSVSFPHHLLSSLVDSIVTL